MRAEVVRTYRIEAAHPLPNHDGKCRNPHGHSYRVEIAYRGEVRPLNGESDEGMVKDFDEIDARWVPLRLQLDHCDLNELLRVPTAEGLAEYIRRAMAADWVTVHETDRGRATVWV